MKVQSVMMTRVVALVLAALVTTGCSLRLPGVGVDVGGGAGGSHGGSHCPPGQAKKGKC